MNAQLQPTGSAYFIAKETEQPENAHAVGAGRQRAGRACARHRPVLRPRLQHREPDGLRDRAREASVAHHHRDARHAACAGADQAPARAHRAGAPRRRPDRARAANSARSGRWSANWRWSRSPARATTASRRCVWPTPSAPSVIDANTEHFIFEITGKVVEDRPVHRHHEAARPGRDLPHRRRRDEPRPAGDVGRPA